MTENSPIASLLPITHPESTVAAATKAHPPLYLVDGSGFIFRAFHALPILTRPDGTPVNAVLGFCNMLVKLLTDLKAAQLAIIFDSARTNFRNDIYPAYKANRSETPPELIPQFPLIREASRAFGLPTLELDGFEADDLIATYARQATERGQQTVIVSSDKDLMQLVNPMVSMFDPMKNITINAPEVEAKFGVPPHLVVDVQALAGDSVDNVPGVAGIGIKTAAELILQYGSLEVLLEQASTIKQPKRRETLIENADKARISKRLVALDSHVPVPLTLGDLTVDSIPFEGVIEFLKAQGFKSIITRLSGLIANPASGLHGALAVGGAVQGVIGGAAHTDSENETAAVSHSQSFPTLNLDSYLCIQTLPQLEAFVADMQLAATLAVDTETSSLVPSTCDLLGISLAFQSSVTNTIKAAYIPLGHSNPKTAEQADLMDIAPVNHEDTPLIQLSISEVIAALRPLLTHPNILKVAHNAKFDLQVLAQHGLEVSPIEDTMLLSYILDGAKHSHGMDALSELHISHTPISYKDVVGTGKTARTFAEVPLFDATRYAAEDADVTLRLYSILKNRLPLAKVASVYDAIERPLIPVIARMETAGIRVDQSRLHTMSADFAKRMTILEGEIHKQAGVIFNLGSPKQLGEVLFDKLGLTGGKKTKTGQWVTDSDVLEDLGKQGHPVVAAMLEWRQLAKLKSTYTDSLQQQIQPKTGRVHTSFAMALTNTGRLSSSDPNLQNIPIRTPDGRHIRTAFVAEGGCQLLSADYSQVELRLVAAIADVDALKDSFASGEDIHTRTAAEVFGLPVSEVTPEVRRSAKAINFGIIYGISGYGLAQQLGCSNGEAQGFITKYLAAYPEISQYMEETREFARQNGFVSTLFGRKCFVPEIADKNPARRQFAERQAINARIQGTAADIIKLAMIGIDGYLQEEVLKGGVTAKLLLQVHDELVLECKDAEVAAVSKSVKYIMENVTPLEFLKGVPLLVEVGHGLSWADAH